MSVQRALREAMIMHHAAGLQSPFLGAEAHDYVADTQPTDAVYIEQDAVVHPMSLLGVFVLKASRVVRQSFSQENTTRY